MTSKDEPLFVFKLNGEFVGEYPSATALSEAMNIPKAMISNHLLGKSKRCYNWVLSRTPEFPGYESTKKGSNPIIWFNNDGSERAAFANVMLAARASKVSFGKIYQQCIGLTKDPELEGYFRYGPKPPPEMQPRHNAPKPVYKFTLEGKFIGSYPSVVAAASDVTVTRQAIQAACLGKQVSAGGFKWSYTAPEPEKD